MYIWFLCLIKLLLKDIHVEADKSLNYSLGLDFASLKTFLIYDFVYFLKYYFFFQNWLKSLKFS